MSHLWGGRDGKGGMVREREGWKGRDGEGRRDGEGGMEREGW